jgi:hypothetical protein
MGLLAQTELSNPGSFPIPNVIMVSHFFWGRDPRRSAFPSDLEANTRKWVGCFVQLKQF